MHIPSQMMDGPIVPVAAVGATLGVVCALCAARRSDDYPSPARFAGITALIFALQMLNFPVQDGTSGHFLGGVAAAIFLGIPFGVLSLTLVLVLQSIVFGDGGVSVLGANIINIALIGAGVGGWLAVRLRDSQTGWKKIAVTALVAWGSVVLAALACSIELAAAGTFSFLSVGPAMLRAHALAGIGEAAVTLLLLAVLPVRARLSTDLKAILIPYGIALLSAVVLSRFASGFPDGLEWAAAELGFQDAGVVSGILPGYSIAWIGDSVASTGLAGLIGVVITAVAAVVLSRVWTRRAAEA